MRQSLLQKNYPLFLAMSVQAAFTSMLTAFSNAANKEEQGWAMGVSGAVIAASFALTGLTPSLVPYIGLKSMISFGGILMWMAAGLMGLYCRRFLKPSIF